MFRLLKELDFRNRPSREQGFQEMRFQDQNMFILSPGNIKIYDIHNHELINDFSIEDMCQTIFINDNAIVSVSPYSDLYIYDFKSLKLLNHIKKASVIASDLTSKKVLLIYDRADKITKKVKINDFSTLWSVEIGKYGKYKLLSGNLFFMTHFLNDQLISCIDWNSGQLFWTLNISDRFDKDFKVKRFIKLNDTGKLLVHIYGQETGKLIEIDAKTGNVIREVMEIEVYVPIYDKTSDILFGLYNQTYSEINLNTESSKSIDLTPLYKEKRNFEPRLTSFNKDYFFAYNELEVDEDILERNYSVIDRNTFEILWEHKCPQIFDEKTRNSLPPTFIDGKLYIYFHEYLWIYEQIKE